ncbi:heme ABC transporter ATP-binding protein [Rhodoplanes sp. TEM]|uniref:Heme ABC transporter ATP-binding protein n=1 Tax=Rhodoplanes tepidamans TaxID=200616 RepID=A0ABT5JDR3_RHOTP|nr:MULTISPECIES: heme ABC transporter ATP-binding protein [Rhodoplanes]MDC7787831.1 heme ABC transporter ATP-binding protein [Rhodoplanes tepidamans]MDC7984499.1 heme ABC transporter ATP-binding protein [Rhodoplanes sp. TEM]MDQ0357908.1 iron complex transport system ATP-binding protein [Rhodoplanes tepidamans]
MTVIAANGVTVRAGRSTLLDGVDLAVAPGETVAIVGPNGAGKSTLLRVLSGDLRPAAGEVRLKGTALSAYPPRKLAGHRAVLSQSLSVAFPFTVDEVVRMGAGDEHGPHADALVEAALAEVDLLACRDRIITTLSGGEQHRAHFARVLVQLARGEADNGPGLLLLDEPTAALDLRHQIDFVALTRARAAAGTAVVAVLHDLNLAASFADRVVVMHRARIAASGPAHAVITEDMLAHVFDVALKSCGLPAGTPCVLPHMISPRARTGPPPAWTRPRA